MGDAHAPYHRNDGPDPEQIVDEGKLERALLRRKWSEHDLARALGIAEPTLLMRLAYGTKAIRDEIERVLGVPRGSLAFPRGEERCP